MSHQLLLLNADEQTMFCKDDVLQTLQSVRGLHGLQEGTSLGSVLRGVFEFQGDTTTVELSDDLKRISLSGTGVAALQIALELKEKLSIPLRAFDSSYTFDVLLNAVHDLYDFQSKITEGEGV